MKSTRLAELNPFAAGMMVLVLLSLIFFGVLTYNLHDLSGKRPTKGDLETYWRIAERMQGGAGYYQAAGEEIRAIGYGRNVFHWRLPFHAWLLSLMQNRVFWRVIIVLLSLLTVPLWMMVFHRHGYHIVMTGVGSLVMTGFVLLAMIPNAFLSHEVWAGTLIALSLGAWGRGWRVLSVASGFAAFLFRELSLPFVGLMFVLAWRERNRKEAMAWLATMVVCSIILALHWSAAAQLVTTDSAYNAGEWMRIGGWSTVLNTARVSAYLLFAPSWLIAVLFPLFVLGLAGWTNGLGLRVFLTVSGYAFIFGLVGKPNNAYWGLMYASLSLLGLMYLPAVIRDLVFTLRVGVRRLSRASSAKP